MALTPSTMKTLGTKAPHFSLPDTNNSMQEKTFSACRGEKATVVLFICNHCPFVVHVKEELLRLYADYEKKGIGFVAISSNDVAQVPQDAPEQMTKQGYPFPYLYDETQETAKAYEAACTPDIFVYDKRDMLVYRGQLDDSRPGNNKPLTGKDLREALDAILAERTPNAQQKPSVGCNIKWK